MKTYVTLLVEDDIDMELANITKEEQEQLWRSYLKYFAKEVEDIKISLVDINVEA